MRDVIEARCEMQRAYCILKGGDSLSSDSKAVEVIAETISKYADELLRMNRNIFTKTGLVEEDLGNGKYRVAIEGMSYIVPSLSNTRLVAGQQTIALFDGDRKYVLGLLMDKGTASTGGNSTEGSSTEGSSGISNITLVTSITADSTDEECPSAKAVYDLFNSIVDGNEVAY